MTKALLTGASGFIGGYLLPRLCGLYDEVITISRREVKKVSKNHIPLTLYRLYNTGDIHIPRYEGIDHIYHFAGCSSPKPNKDNPNEVFNANVNFTNLLLSQYANDITKFVFASTIKVYGNTTECYAHETLRDWWNIFRPTCLYGVSKAAAEECVRLYSKQYGFEHQILRLCPILSPCRTTGLITYLKSQILSGEINVNVPDVIRPYLHISDAIDGILEFKPPNRTWNLSSRNSITAMEIAKYIQSRLDTKHITRLRLATQPSWDMDTREIRVDTDSLSEYWKPKMTIMETIDAVIK